MPDQARISENTVHVELHRPYRFSGSANAFEIKDNDQAIGRISPNSTLAWERQPGQMELSAEPIIGGMGAFTPITDTLSGGMKYSYSVTFPFWYPLSRSAFSKAGATPLPLTYSTNQGAGLAHGTQGHKLFTPGQFPDRNWVPVNIAVADITAYTLSQGEAKTLTEKVNSTLVQTDYFTVLSRSDMKAVLDAQKFQRSDACDDTSCLVEMGKILSVQKIVGGTLGKVGTTFSISLRFVDVESGKTEFTVDDEWKGEPDALLKLVQDTAKRLAAEYARRKADQ